MLTRLSTIVTKFSSIFIRPLYCFIRLSFIFVKLSSRSKIYDVTPPIRGRNVTLNTTSYNTLSLSSIPTSLPIIGTKLSFVFIRLPYRFTRLLFIFIRLSSRSKIYDVTPLIRGHNVTLKTTSYSTLSLSSIPIRLSTIFIKLSFIFIRPSYRFIRLLFIFVRLSSIFTRLSSRSKTYDVIPSIRGYDVIYKTLIIKTLRPPST